MINEVKNQPLHVKRIHGLSFVENHFFKNVIETVEVEIWLSKSMRKQHLVSENPRILSPIWMQRI
jgi:hypothetical protein